MFHSLVSTFKELKYFQPLLGIDVIYCNMLSTAADRRNDNAIYNFFM